MSYFAIEGNVDPLGQIIHPLGDRARRDRRQAPFPDPSPGDRDSTNDGGDAEREPNVSEHHRPARREGDDILGGTHVDIRVSGLDGAVRFLPTRQKAHAKAARTTAH